MHFPSWKFVAHCFLELLCTTARKENDKESDNENDKDNEKEYANENDNEDTNGNDH